MSATLPDDVKKYAESSVFTEDTCPQKLRREHDAKPGVWGSLVVLEGALDFIVPGPPLTTQHVDTDTITIIEPMVLHYVVLKGPVRFKVEFFN